MGRWVWILPLVFLAGCSKTDSTRRASGASSQPSVIPASTAGPESSSAVIPRGTPLRVRVDEPLNTRRNRSGDSFLATLEAPVTVDGRTVLPAGTLLLGRVALAAPPGRRAGRAVLTLALDAFELDGRELRIQTTRVERRSAADEKRNAAIPGEPEVGVPERALLTFSLEAPLRI